MPRKIRAGVKHGGVTGGSHPNSYKTNVIPGANPRGDGKLSCGHPATQPPVYLIRKKPRFQGDVDLYFARRVCQTCYEFEVANPNSIWKPTTETGEQGNPSETALERENRSLRVLCYVAMTRLKQRPDWPLVQKLARLALDVEQLLNDESDDDNDAAIQAIMDRMEAHYMDAEVLKFLGRLDETNLLPDGRPGRLIARPSVVTVEGILNSYEPAVSLEPRSQAERDAIDCRIAVGEPRAELQ